MAQGKKSFIIYTDSRSMVNKLSNERAGILFKTLFSYCDDENPICDDEVVDMVFEHFKSILKRDLKKYESIIDRNRENGKKGGRPQTQKNPLGYLETQPNPTEPKKADTDNVNVTVNDNVNVTLSLKEDFDFSKIKNTSWANEFRKKKGLNSVERFNQIFDRFIDNIKLKGQHLDYKDPEKEVKNHFVNWYDKQDFTKTQPTVKRNNVVGFNKE
jgi:hypothetical protein